MFATGAQQSTENPPVSIIKGSSGSLLCSLDLTGKSLTASSALLLLEEKFVPNRSKQDFLCPVSHLHQWLQVDSQEKVKTASKYLFAASSYMHLCRLPEWDGILIHLLTHNRNLIHIYKLSELSTSTNYFLFKFNNVLTHCMWSQELLGSKLYHSFDCFS